MDIICLSHLRWNFVYQRPQHLMTRFARQCRVFYIEEPLFDSEDSSFDAELNEDDVNVISFHLSANLTDEARISEQQKLMLSVFDHFKIDKYVSWYYTPMALDIMRYTPALLVIVYDCMDELSAFKFAPPILKEKEKELLRKADVVFTGGHTLYEAKKHLHPNIHPFPSSIDRKHFAKAREVNDTPIDQIGISHPRIGFYGVIDERMDLDLLDKISEAQPGWNFVIIGPVVKIDPASLPRRKNIHYLGNKSYTDLPQYLSGWDVGMLPFEINESTRYISPTKTPEYLAGGKPVVSTPITDVINPYGEKGLVYIGGSHNDFIKGIEWALEVKENKTWSTAVDTYLENMSWDKTWNKMMYQVISMLSTKEVSVSTH